MILPPLWLPVALAAALFQCWRTALQQRLRGQLSLNAAAVVRYLYGVPVGAALLARPLRVLSLGAAGAAGLGLNVALVRLAAMALAVAMAAAVSAELGLIGFVGLAAPALARTMPVGGTPLRLAVMGVREDKRLQPAN